MKTKTILITLIGLLTINILVFQACEKEDEPNISPSCEITVPSDGEQCIQGKIVTISAVAADSDGNIAEVKFFIDDVSKSSVNSAPYTYDWNTAAESIGSHTIKAVSFDNDGASTSDEVTIEIIEGGSTPVPAFTATPTFGDAPLTVDFTDQSTNSPTNWYWDFGDGKTSSEQNPSNIYDEVGRYTVALTVSNEYGTDLDSKIGFIAVSVIVADFSANTTGGQAPHTVIFSDESLRNPTSWQWDFGDGGGSTEQNPSHTYNQMALYDVTLTVSNENSSDTETKANFITVNGGGLGTLIDARDEQTYELVTIGNQTWFAENLKYETNDSWWYDNLSANGDIYGRLYAWEASLMTCPSGWHVPSDDEWKILEGTVDSNFPVGDPEWDVTGDRGFNAGNQLKSINGWNTNVGTDAVGFTALPGGGFYTGEGGFDFIDDYALFWTATEQDINSISAYSRGLYSSYRTIARVIVKKEHGKSVRCIKDE